MTRVIGAVDNSRIVEEPDTCKQVSPVLNGRVTGRPVTRP